MYARCCHVNGSSVVRETGFVIVFVYGGYANNVVVRCRIHGVGYVIVACCRYTDDAQRVGFVENSLFGGSRCAAAPRHANYINPISNGIFYALETCCNRAIASFGGFNGY